MARLLSLVFGLVAVASAFPMHPENCTYDKAVAIINRVLSSPFAQYIPDDVTAQMKDIILPQNQAELQNLVDLHNKVMSGEIPQPTSQAEGMAFLQKYAPLTYPRAKTLMDNYQGKVANLSVAARTFLVDQQKAFENVSKTGDMQSRIVEQIHAILAQDAAYRALSPSVKQEFRTQWPTIMRFCDSPMYTMIISILKGANNSNLPQTVASLMALWGHGTTPAPQAA